MNNHEQSRDYAQAGLQQIENATLRLLDANPQGLRNVDVARALGLTFDFGGKYKNHVTYGVLGSLLSRDVITRDEESKLFLSRNGDTSGKKVAQAGLQQIEEAILEILERHPEGLRNAEIAQSLGLTSDFRGSYKNYLTYTVLMSLIAKSKVARTPQTKLFTIADNKPTVG